MVSILLLVVGWSVSKFEWPGFYLIPGDVAWLVDSRAVGHLVGMTGVVVFMCAFALLAPIIQKDFERRKKQGGLYIGSVSILFGLAGGLHF